MTTVAQKAHYVRSKNAGPFWVTIDIFCENDEDFLAFKNSALLTPDIIADVYGVSVSDVKVFYLPAIHVMKISYPRLCPQGGRYERDMHSGQQYVQIMNLPI